MDPIPQILHQMLFIKKTVLSRTKEPSSVKENPFGLKNMSGNVAEFCLDFYSPDTYKADTVSCS